MIFLKLFREKKLTKIIKINGKLLHKKDWDYVGKPDLLLPKFSAKVLENSEKSRTRSRGNNNGR